MNKIFLPSRGARRRGARTRERFAGRSRHRGVQRSHTVGEYERVIEAVEAALNVGDDLVEIVGPVGNEESCRYCYSVRVTSKRVWTATTTSDRWAR